MRDKGSGGGPWGSVKVGEVSFIVGALQSDDTLVDHRLEGAEEQKDGGCDYWEGPGCAEEMCISVFLVRKADHQIISLGSSEADGGYEYGEGPKHWNEAQWAVPNFECAVGYEHGNASHLLSGGFVIKATIYSKLDEPENTEECPGCYVCKRNNEYFEANEELWDRDDVQCCQASRTVTGVKLSLVKMGYSDDYRFTPQGRNSSVLNLLKNVEMNLRRWS